MAEARAPNPLVEQFQRGGVPRELRLMAAQGALPLKPADLVELLELLLHDADGEVAKAADATLRATSADDMQPIARDRSTPPRVLAWIVVHRQERPVREVALQNTSLADEVIESIVEDLPSELAELVVINQTRLLRRTSLLEALERNLSLSNDQKRRLRELRESFHIGEVAEPAPPPVVEAPPPPPPPPPPEPEEAEAVLTEEEVLAESLTEEERKDAEKVSAVQRLYRMTTAEKVIAALKGTREERTLLIRDRNRLVSTAVLGSPRVTDTEIESFAAMKNLSDEVLRKIGNNREWTKKYGVVVNLVKNPRTPIGVSMGLVSRLNPRDLKGLAIDRNVPEAIRKQAQRFVKGAEPQQPQKK